MKPISADEYLWVVREKENTTRALRISDGKKFFLRRMCRYIDAKEKCTITEHDCHLECTDMSTPFFMDCEICSNQIKLRESIERGAIGLCAECG